MNELLPVNQLVLSLFPGVDLLGRAFSSAGFCVVRGPDLIVGQDIREFAGVRGKIDGIIGGPPCQGFSAINSHKSNPDHPSVINSREMLRQFIRVVEECCPTWWLCENVPAVPDVKVRMHGQLCRAQRIPITDLECGGVQLRSRHFQFGHQEGYIIRPDRVNDYTRNRKKGRPAIAVTTKTRRYQDFPDLCQRQGLPRSFRLPGWYKQAKHRAVGNGVPLSVGRVIAAAVSCAGPRGESDCPCGCGRVLTGQQTSASVSCRKRLQLDRDRSRAYVDRNGFHAEREFAAH